MKFEEKKFCQIRTLAHRWDCSTDRIYDLISKGRLKVWHPEGNSGCRGMLVDVRSVLKVEREGYISYGVGG